MDVIPGSDRLPLSFVGDFELMDVKFWIDIAVGVIAIASFLGTALFYYRAKVQKSYAAERDFIHLRRNQEQLISLISEERKEIDSLSDAVKSLSFTCGSFDKRLDKLIDRFEDRLNLFRRDSDEG